ncbi:DUF2442 domain-containing protein [Ectothiorhodospira shaposhnikovii]|uniref:DUF2442 domain-containing protein n=1 Tax=Ectothiorhodospira shaposhnikovii TaxID=1054 RepID=UPI0039A2212C
MGQHMIKILRLKILGQQRFLLFFSDSRQGVFDLQDYLSKHSGNLLKPLHDPGFAEKAFIDAGALCWPHGLELSPARLYELAAMQDAA